MKTLFKHIDKEGIEIRGLRYVWPWLWYKNNWKPCFSLDFWEPCFPWWHYGMWKDFERDIKSGK